MDEKLKQSILELKDEFKIFCLLNDDEMEKVIPYFEAVDLSAGSVLFTEGDPGSFIGFVRSGKLEVKKQTEFKGRQIVLAVLGKGSFVGELSVLDEQPRSATVAALENSTLFLLKRDALDSFMETQPHIGIKILRGIGRILSIRLRKAVDRLAVIF